MRDRLAELGQSGKKPQNDDIEFGTVATGDPEIKKFFQQVTEIRGLIDSISENTLKIEQLYTASLAAARDEDVTRGTQEVEDLIHETNRSAASVKNKLKAMKLSNEELEREEREKEKNADGLSVDARLRSSQHSALSQKLVSAMAEYQEVQTKCKAKFRQRMERQYLIVKPDANSEEIEQALENNKGPIFSQQFLAQTQRAEAKKALKDIQDRHAEILKLEQSLRELNELFVDMQILVESQGQMLNEIENAVDKAVDYTEKGVEEMKRAIKYQKKSRKKMLIIVCCLIIVLLIIIIPILVKFIPQN